MGQNQFGFPKCDGHITGKGLSTGWTNFLIYKKSRNPKRCTGKWCGVDEARTRDLLRDGRVQAPDAN